jgi:hypothetical protein
MFPYTPFTSEALTGTGAIVSDLSSFGNITGTLPSGKQVIFFTVGLACIITSIALISRALIGDNISPDVLAKIAPLAA